MYEGSHDLKVLEAHVRVRIKETVLRMAGMRMRFMPKGVTIMTLYS